MNIARRVPEAFKMNASVIRKHDERVRALHAAVQPYKAEEILIVTGRNIFYPATINRLPIRNDELFRELSATLPEYTVLEIAPDRDYHLRANQYNTDLVYDSTIIIPESVEYVLFAFNHLPQEQQPNNLLLERQTDPNDQFQPYYLGVMTRPFTFVGYTVQRDKDI